MSKSTDHLAVAFGLVVLSIGPGCNATSQQVAKTNQDSAAKDTLLVENREKAYRDVDSVFENALLYKPLDGSAPEEIFKFAPLIVQEVNASQAGSNSLKLSGPVVYYHETTVRTSSEHMSKAIVFFWCHGSDPILGRRAIRITLAEDGFPAVFETYTEPDPDFELLFISKSLESASAVRHGSPLQGRRFSIETSIDKAPRIVVARILDDGPIPMGPFVYLSKTDSTFTTLLCRCMASQVRQFVENGYYELRPSSTVADAPKLNFPGDARPLQEILRMPPMR